MMQYKSNSDIGNSQFMAEVLSLLEKLPKILQYC